MIKEIYMKLTKKIKCLKCGVTVEDNGRCTCNTVILVRGDLILKEGSIPGVDYEDCSQQLLNE